MAVSIPSVLPLAGLLVPTARACCLLRAALRSWLLVTQVRSELRVITLWVALFVGNRSQVVLLFGLLMFVQLGVDHARNVRLLLLLLASVFLVAELSREQIFIFLVVVAKSDIVRAAPLVVVTHQTFVP